MRRHDNHMQKVKAKHEEEERLRAAVMEESVQKEHVSKKVCVCVCVVCVCSVV